VGPTISSLHDSVNSSTRRRRASFVFKIIGAIIITEELILFLDENKSSVNIFIVIRILEWTCEIEKVVPLKRELMGTR
jgi:hypothetical protein